MSSIFFNCIRITAGTTAPNQKKAAGWDAHHRTKDNSIACLCSAEPASAYPRGLSLFLLFCFVSFRFVSFSGSQVTCLVPQARQKTDR